MGVGAFNMATERRPYGPTIGFTVANTSYTL